MEQANGAQMGGVVQSLYRSSIQLLDGWLDQIKNTPEDLFAAFVMVIMTFKPCEIGLLMIPNQISMTLEGCNSDLSWKIFGHACSIARALGYFSLDGDSTGPDGQIAPAQASKHRNEVERNRMRFEFWHLLRTDCLFRLSFGKPTLLPEGSWAVNLPDPTITGVDDPSSHFIQIHFLASMRLTLVALKYLDWANAESDQSTATFDSWLDDLIAEVEAILSDWNVVCLPLFHTAMYSTFAYAVQEKLMSTTENLVDRWFCADILFTSYRIIIILSQAKRCNRDSYHWPRHTVNLARRSLNVFQSLMASMMRSYWGIRYSPTVPRYLSSPLTDTSAVFCYSTNSYFSSFYAWTLLTAKNRKILKKTLP
jgi:hypothetical protein